MTHRRIKKDDPNQQSLAAAAQHSLTTQRKWYFLLSEGQATGIARGLRNGYYQMKKVKYQVSDHIHELSGSDADVE